MLEQADDAETPEDVSVMDDDELDALLDAAAAKSGGGAADSAPATAPDPADLVEVADDEALFDSMVTDVENQTAAAEDTLSEDDGVAKAGER